MNNIVSKMNRMWSLIESQLHTNIRDAIDKVVEEETDTGNDRGENHAYTFPEFFERKSHTARVCTCRDFSRSPPPHRPIDNCYAHADRRRL